MSLDNLNQQQKQAVTHGDGPLLIVAGAGTGKTTVITRRVAWLIEQGLAKGDEILALTFTDKAAGEMEERVDRLLPYGYVDLWISTFHSFCDRILKDHGLEIGLPTDYKLLDQTEQWLLVRQNLDKFNLDYYRPLGNPTKFIHALLKHFSRCKDEVIAPSDYLEYAEGLKLDMDSMESTGGQVRKESRIKNQELSCKGGSELNSEFSTLDSSEIKRLEEVANAYHVYQQLLLDNNSLDFGDLINYCLKLFRDRSHILKFYQNKFKYILVDEFQDTNWAQYELVKMLASDKENLSVVADDDQCLPGDSLVDLSEGKKKIKDIKIGDEVITAVGKGHLGIQKVSKVFKNKREARLVTIKLKSGKEIKVTDNHKMFCFVPRVSDKKYYYVYLMFRQGMGWRMGVTNDLAVRLSLERSADKILAVRAFKSEQEARYYETYWSLKFGIPTTCFKERDGVIIKDELLKMLYEKIDVGNNVKKLADELGIDLDWHHYCLDGVTRGKSRRVKIHLKMCMRRHRSKDHVRSCKELMRNPSIMHQVQLETSNREVIRKLQSNGFNLKKTKKGYRLRVNSADIKEIGNIADGLKKIIGGFVEAKFNLGTLNCQHKPALILPAKNLVQGLYLPIRKGKDVVYDQIVDIKARWISQKVYDLEVAKTHNFIANGVVVHNSIFKFRGASVSNIIQFQEDYPKAKFISLVENYRSRQNILDLAYNFIQLNNPERLEYRFGTRTAESSARDSAGDGPGRRHSGMSPSGDGKLSKKLKSQTADQGIIEHLHVGSEEDEVTVVVNKILEIYGTKSAESPTGDSAGEGSNHQSPITNHQVSWNDFCILVRANRQAEAFANALERAGITYQYVASKGLYGKPIIMDLIAYLKLLDNYHESTALWRVLNMPVFNFEHKDLVELNHLAYKKSWSLFETVKRAKVEIKLKPETYKLTDNILNLIDRHSRLATNQPVSRVLTNFLIDSGYEKYLVEDDTQAKRDSLRYLNQFYKKIQEFEKSFDDKSVKNFMAMMDLELESGEMGSLIPNLEEGPEAVKLMTVHTAKGLEFKYVFIVQMVDKRFPSTERHDPIQIPDALVKEIIPQGDIHLQEERRLFYVAMTRAKDGLYLTSADDYGGTRKKKLSRFVYEIGMEKGIEGLKGKEGQGQQKEKGPKRLKGLERASLISPFQPSKPLEPPSLPEQFSYTQFKAFETCPLQYKFAHVLKVPTKGSYQASFGRTIHTTLQKFFQLMMDKGKANQGNLFGQSINKEIKNSDQSLPSLDELLNIYEACWIDDWYENMGDQKKSKDKGRQALKVYYEKIKDNLPEVKFLEKKFNLKIGDYTLKGTIDRIDRIDDGVVVIDYKTGSFSQSKVDKNQLYIYQLAMQEIFEEKVSSLIFNYIMEDREVKFLGDEKNLEKLKQDVLSNIEKIKNSSFEADPSQFKCQWCDFKSICSFRE